MEFVQSVILNIYLVHSAQSTNLLKHVYTAVKNKDCYNTVYFISAPRDRTTEVRLYIKSSVYSVNKFQLLVRLNI